MIAGTPIVSDTTFLMMLHMLCVPRCMLARQDYTSDTTGNSISAGVYYNFEEDGLDGIPSSLLDNQCSINPWVAILFFFSFTLLFFFALIQLFIAVILDNLKVGNWGVGCLAVNNRCFSGLQYARDGLAYIAIK